MTGSVIRGKDGDSFTVQVDPSQKDRNFDIQIPSGLIDRFAPHQSRLQSWLQPTATILAAVIAIGAAVIAWLGVRMQVRRDKDKEHLADLWERFEWVVDKVKGGDLNLEQTTVLLTSIITAAATLDEGLTLLILAFVRLVMDEVDARNAAAAKAIQLATARANQPAAASAVIGQA